MRNLLLLFCILLPGIPAAIAQKRPVVTGTVFSTNGHTQPFAYILILKNEAKITGATANEDGSYRIVLPDTGSYTARVGLVGFTTLYIPFHVKSSDTVLLDFHFNSEVPDRSVCITYNAPVISKDQTASSVKVRTNLFSPQPKGQDAKKRSSVSAPYPTGTATTLRGSRDKSWYQSQDNDFRDYKDNSFLSVRRQPLSTFSADVDKASYALVQKYVYASEKVPKGAVRTEELINYFPYDYPQPDDEHPFRIINEVSECPWNKNSRLIKIALQGKKIDAGALPASVFTFLIDVSGSMFSPDKLPLVKASLQKLLDQLRPQDKVGLVVYAGAAGVVLEPVSASERGLIMKKILALDAGGSTAGGQGIQLAYHLAEKHFVPGGNNRIILCTDGDFNVGIHSDEDLTTFIEEQREKGIFLTVLGYGMGNYKDGRLEILADKGNGNYAYINSYDEAVKLLGREFAGSMYVIAKDVKIQIEFNPALVKSYRLIGYENRLLQDEDFNNDKADAGEIGVGHTVTALYEIRADEKFSGQIDELKYTKSGAKDQYKEIATVKFRYKEPAGKQSKLIVQEIKDITHSWEQTSAESRFAICVAAFAQILRGSEYVKNLSLSELIRETRKLNDIKPDAERIAFVDLMEKYARIQETDK